MKNKLSISLLSICLSLSCLDAAAANIGIRAKIDSVSMLMGRMNTLRLEVTQDTGTKGEFEIFSESSHNGLVSVCGDSVELRTSFSRDTTNIGTGRIQINYAIPVQAFDSGAYILPPFRYIAGRDTFLSNRVALKVVPVKAGADEAISDYAGTLAPEGRFTDSWPDWIVNYWWMILIFVIGGCVAAYAVIRYRKNGTVMPAKKQPSPYESALRALSRLKERKLWENGMEKEYFTHLTDILRRYLDRRFGINAMEMTSHQIMSKLADDAEIRDKRDYMRRILDMADYVKFAKMRPLPEDNIAAFDNAVRFIEETKPAPQSEDTDGSKASDSDKKGGKE